MAGRPENLKNLHTSASQHLSCYGTVSYTHLDVYKRQTLHNAIFVAFDRDDHHLYSFYFSSRPTSTSRNRLAGALRYGCPYSETDDRADITRVDSLPLNLKGRFEYLFDYGDEWWHEITLEEIHPPQKDVKYPLVIASGGDSPAQYPDAEDF